MIHAESIDYRPQSCSRFDISRGNEIHLRESKKNKKIGKVREKDREGGEGENDRRE